MPSTEREQPNRLLRPAHAGYNSGGTSTEADLLSIRRDFPAFRIWREITGYRISFVARRRQPGTRPHTVVTRDADELRAVLAGNSQSGEPEAPAEALPADFAHLLVTRLGLSSAEVAVMSREEAIARMQEFWNQPG